MKLTGGFLCGGGGGAAIGFQQAGHKINWMIDNNPFKCQMWENNLPGKVFNRDLCLLPPDKTKDCNFLFFSPPYSLYNPACNFGKQPQLEIPELAIKVISYISHHQPLVFMMECLHYYKQSHGYELIKDWFETSYGYECFTVDVDYSRFGVPQKRHRHLLIGGRKRMIDSLILKRKFNEKKKTPQANWNDYLDRFDFSPHFAVKRKPWFDTHRKNKRYWEDRDVILYTKRKRSQESGNPAPTIHTSIGMNGSAGNEKNRRDFVWIYKADINRWFPVNIEMCRRLQTFPNLYDLPKTSYKALQILGDAMPPEAMKQIMQLII